MKGLTKFILLSVVLIFCIQAVAAFAVSSITVDPSGSLVPSTPVIITYKVDFTGSGDETFPSGDEIQMSTDLDAAKWTYTLVLDGVETPQPDTSGRVVSVSGWVLSYPASKEESLKVTVQGNAPSITQTANKTLIKLCEFDSHGNLMASSCVERTTVIVNVADINNRISQEESALQTYRSHIDEKSALGVDTAEGEAKYSEAQQKIAAAKSTPSTQYLQAFANIDSAQKAIDDGESALDRAWAEGEVQNSQIPINNVDAVIQWFKANQSTASDAQLPAIIAKREVAVSYISTANDEITNGNYAQARAKAEEAFAKGNESYTDALARQYQIIHGGFLPDLSNLVKLGGLGKLVLPIAAVIIIVVAVVGFIIYRKRSRWDELG